ncbi:MAG: CocE/NonD family hydrolase [Pseudomonadota bacterium]
MPDGVLLSARIWMPPEKGVEGSNAGYDTAYPAIFEYIPYRKRDLVRRRDERNHPVFAAHGYVSMRVDMRGSGDSEGVMPDMYTPEEMADAHHIIAWIVAQPWCSGRVGMFGTSWGGTASLQAAIDAHPALHAVLASCATIDRFEDDIHWMGGNVLTDTVEWGATLPAILGLPPDPQTASDVTDSDATDSAGWVERWMARLNALQFPLDNWIGNQIRGDYWRRGSVRFSLDRLSCPVLAVGGWGDRYSNCVMPLVDARPDLCWGVVGPWSHHYADHGAPGPAVSFQTMALAWWDHWLKDDPAGPPDWPRLRLWQRSFDPPQDRLDRRSGGWIAVAPNDAPPVTTFHLGDGVLTPTRVAHAGTARVPFNLMHGTQSGDTGYFGRIGGLPLDQAPDDARALCFESDAHDEAIDVVGAAMLKVVVCRETPTAQLVCRLCDVAPDGRSNLVTRAILNLELDDTLHNTRLFSAGEPQEVTVTFPTTAYRFAPGHRIRLAIGGSYWPLVWPPHVPTDIGIDLDATHLTLPGPPSGTCAVGPPAEELIYLPESGLLRTPASVTDGHMHSSWELPPATSTLDEINRAFTVSTIMTYDVDLDNPASTVCTALCEISLDLHDTKVSMRSKATIHVRNGCLVASGKMTARQDGDVIWERVFGAEPGSA